MSASRESFDLFTKHGRRAFWHSMRYPIATMFNDTFVRLYCRAFGHKVQHKKDRWDETWTCSRCHAHTATPNNYVPQGWNVMEVTGMGIINSKAIAKMTAQLETAEDKAILDKLNEMSEEMT
jgi:hypothetical protein